MPDPRWQGLKEGGGLEGELSCWHTPNGVASVGCCEGTSRAYAAPGSGLTGFLGAPMQAECTAGRRRLLMPPRERQSISTGRLGAGGAGNRALSLATSCAGGGGGSLFLVLASPRTPRRTAVFCIRGSCGGRDIGDGGGGSGHGGGRVGPIYCQERSLPPDTHISPRLVTVHLATFALSPKLRWPLPPEMPIGETGGGGSVRRRPKCKESRGGMGLACNGLDLGRRTGGPFGPWRRDAWARGAPHRSPM